MTISPTPAPKAIEALPRLRRWYRGTDGMVLNVAGDWVLHSDVAALAAAKAEQAKSNRERFEAWTQTAAAQDAGRRGDAFTIAWGAWQAALATPPQPPFPDVERQAASSWQYLSRHSGLWIDASQEVAMHMGRNGYTTRQIRTTPKPQEDADVERQARSPEQLMAEVDALKVDMTAQMRRDSGRAALEDRQAVGYVSPHGLEELRKGGSQTINTVASAKYTVPLFATPPQEAGDADAERLDWLDREKEGIAYDGFGCWEIMGQGVITQGSLREAIDAGIRQHEVSIMQEPDASRIAMEERKT